MEDIEEELERSGRHRELAKRLETALVAHPPPDAREAETLRRRLVSLYQDALHEPQRAIVHLEALLAGDSLSEAVEQVAERMLEHRVMAPRVAALLSDAYGRLGRTGNEISMLTRELRLSRPPRLGTVQRRLAVLREEVLDDAEGAVELLEALIDREPGDDESRRRYVAHSVVLRRSKEAARALSRAMRSAKGCVRARVGLDIGLLYLAHGDGARAMQALAQALEEEDCNDGARLEAARRLLALRPELSASVLARALAVVAEREPDPGARVLAARELLEIGERAPLIRTSKSRPGAVFPTRSAKTRRSRSSRHSTKPWAIGERSAWCSSGEPCASRTPRSRGRWPSGAPSSAR